MVIMVILNLKNNEVEGDGRDSNVKYPAMVSHLTDGAPQDDNESDQDCDNDKDDNDDDKSTL